MKILVDLVSFENIDKYKAAGFIVSSSEFSCFNGRCFDFLEIEEINNYTNSNKKTLVVSIDRIIEEDELDSLKEYIDKLLTLDIDYFIYGDFAVLNYFREKGLTHKLIYDPKTLITNYYEADFHNQFNSLVSINNELTIDEIKDTIKAGNSLMEVYGFHQMFYSRRALLSNFAKFKKESNDLTLQKLIIKEEKRDHSYPIYESKNGTFIYTSKIYCLFKELVELQDLRFIRINSAFLEENNVIKVVDLYNKLLNNFNLNEDLFEELKLIDDRIDSGFLYKKSVVLKEASK